MIGRDRPKIAVPAYRKFLSQRIGTPCHNLLYKKILFKETIVRIAAVSIILISILILNGSCQDHKSMDEIYITSIEKGGYDVYVDGQYVGTEGTNGDVPDGNFTVFVPGDSKHSVTTDDGKFIYGLRDFNFGDGLPYLFSSGDPQLKLGPSFHPNSAQANLNSIPVQSGQVGSSGQNVLPDINSLNPDIQTPQQVGATVTWRATASDPENDPIYYRFSLNGPRTGTNWQVVQDWSQNDVWSWNIGDDDVGSSNIRVEIRDGKHEDISGADAFKEFDNYQIETKQLTQLNVEVTNDVYTENDRHMYYCQDGKYIEFKNRIYLIGSDLDKVKSVQYVLHESFQDNPAPVSEDRANDFEIWITTWGRFPIKALITTTNGQLFNKDYDFSFKSKVEAAQRLGIPMVQRCDG
jgi:hypothetical protein